jgi:hypothetical protein
MSLEIIAGTDILEAATDMVRYAKTHDCVVIADFNGIELKVYEFSDPDSVVKYYHLENEAQP